MCFYLFTIYENKHFFNIDDPEMSTDVAFLKKSLLGVYVSCICQLIITMSKIPKILPLKAELQLVTIG